MFSSLSISEQLVDDMLQHLSSISKPEAKEDEKEKDDDGEIKLGAHASNSLESLFTCFKKIYESHSQGRDDFR